MWSGSSSGDMDVEMYVGRYSGYTVFQRLKFIMEHAAADETRMVAHRALISALKARYWLESYGPATHVPAHSIPGSNTT